MLIVSWNVAGLKPALQKIYSDYGPSRDSNRNGNVNVNGNGGNDGDGIKAKSTPPSSSFHPFADYLRRHGDVDVLCLQEHKIPLAQLRDRAEPRSCSTVPGYESFWACATGRSCRGFNGVATYCKSGLVRAADGAPLGDPELDAQGRCVVTDHGAFVLFNVYAPHAGGTGPEGPAKLRNKVRFLRALQAAMARQRAEGKRVMLVGDLNLKIDKRDIYWKNRCLNVNVVLEQIRQRDDSMNHSNDDEFREEPPKWKRDVAEHWEQIDQVLETIEAVPRQTTNPTTKETFDRFRARVKLGENNFVMLGNHEDTAEDALACYQLGEQSEIIEPDANDAGPATVIRKANVLCVDVLVELMCKICNVTWNASTQRQIADSEEAGLNPDSPSYLWINSLLGDGMVDVFRHFYPTAEARFTCWHQLKNKRYNNEGGRIDFTLVDKELLDQVDQPGNGQTLRCGKGPHNNPLGEEAALMAATAGGLFEGGSFHGGGIAFATRQALDTQFGEAHTGMIYTPPSYSDHVAVSLLMKRGFREAVVGALTLADNASTRKAQPHKSQRSISSFFGAKAASSGGAAVSSGSKKRALSLQPSQASNKTARENGSTMSSFFLKSVTSSGGKKATSREAQASKQAATKKGSARGPNSSSSSSNKRYWHFGKK